MATPPPPGPGQRHAPSRAARALLAVAIMLATALAGCSGTPDAPAPAQRATFATVQSSDGHAIPVTVYRPEGPGAVPVVLHSHGWGGVRETRLEAFRAFTDAGLAVVSIDMRGHGEARGTSQARVADPAHEGKDILAILDHLAKQDWVRTEDGDPVVGAMGTSYGGSFGLLAGAADGRLDAIVAEDTWNDLASAMVPNGVPKTGWFASLWLSGATQASIHPDVRLGFETAIQRDELPDGDDGPDLAAMFAASSPGVRPPLAKAPTLLVQGANDTLFDFGQALANLERLHEAGVEAALVTHLAGHAFAARQAPSGPMADRHPCGAPDDLALAWMRRHLLGDPVDVPQACVTLGDGTVRRGPSVPLPGTATVAVDVGAMRVRPGDAASRATSAPLGLQGDAVVGAPRLRGTAGATDGATVYWGLVDAHGRLANGQVAPMRLAPGDPADFTLDLPALAVPAPGLSLALFGHSSLFATHPASPEVAFTGLRLELPVVPADS